jgi:hypothetical protein
LKLAWVKHVKISKLAKQLVKTIFTYDWMRRPSIVDLLNHEWVKPNDENKYNLRPRPNSAKHEIVNKNESNS